MPAPRGQARFLSRPGHDIETAYRHTTQGPVTKEALGRFAVTEQRSMGTGNGASATENVLAAMRVVLDELDRQGREVAAAYVPQAISVIERQAAADDTSAA